MSELLHKIRESTGGAMSGALTSSRDRIAQRQLRKDLDKLYWKLGKEVISLLDAEEIDHPALRERRERIQAQIKKLRKA